jgi:hypothetical protein
MEENPEPVLQTAKGLLNTNASGRLDVIEPLVCRVDHRRVWNKYVGIAWIARIAN